MIKTGELQKENHFKQKEHKKICLIAKNPTQSQIKGTNNG